MYKDSIRLWFGVGLGILNSKRKTREDDRYYIYYLVLPFFIIKLFKAKYQQTIGNWIKKWYGLGLGILSSNHKRGTAYYFVFLLFRIRIF